MLKKILVWGGIAIAVVILLGMAGSPYALGQWAGSIITGFIDAVTGFADGISGK